MYRPIIIASVAIPYRDYFSLAQLETLQVSKVKANDNYYSQGLGPVYRIIRISTIILVTVTAL